MQGMTANGSNPSLDPHPGTLFNYVLISTGMNRNKFCLLYDIFSWKLCMVNFPFTLTSHNCFFLCDPHIYEQDTSAFPYVYFFYFLFFLSLRLLIVC